MKDRSPQFFVKYLKEMKMNHLKLLNKLLKYLRKVGKLHMNNYALNVKKYFYGKCLKKLKKEYFKFLTYFNISQGGRGKI